MIFLNNIVQLLKQENSNSCIKKAASPNSPCFFSLYKLSCEGAILEKKRESKHLRGIITLPVCCMTEIKKNTWKPTSECLQLVTTEVCSVPYIHSVVWVLMCAICYIKVVYGHFQLLGLVLWNRLKNKIKKAHLHCCSQCCQCVTAAQTQIYSTVYTTVWYSGMLSSSVCPTGLSKVFVVCD